MLPRLKGMIPLCIIAVIFVVTACRSTPNVETARGSNGQTLSTEAVSARTQPADGLVWGRIAYCNCLADAATANVKRALQDAQLTAGVKEQSPRDGWLYFVVTFDPQITTADQVSKAMTAGGAEVVPQPQ